MQVRPRITFHAAKVGEGADFDDFCKTHNLKGEFVGGVFRFKKNVPYALNREASLGDYLIKAKQGVQIVSAASFEKAYVAVPR